MTNIDQSNPGRVVPPSEVITYDHERLSHLVSEEQLTMIANGGKTISLEVSVCALGIAMGFARDVFNLYSVVESSQTVGLTTVAGSAIFCVSTTVFVAAAIYHRRVKGNVDTVLAAIRARKRGTIRDEPYKEGRPFSGDPSVPRDTTATTD